MAGFAKIHPWGAICRMSLKNVDSPLLLRPTSPTLFLGLSLKSTRLKSFWSAKLLERLELCIMGLFVTMKDFAYCIQKP